MRTMKKILLLGLSFNVSYSYSQDYFNPLFLGSDVDSINDLSYLSSGNNVTPGKYFLSINAGEIFLRSMNVDFVEDKQKKVSACFTHEMIGMLPFNKDALSRINARSENEKCVDIASYIENFSYDVDLSKLTLTLQIPQIYLKSLRSTLANESDWDDGIPVLITNYNFNGSYTKNKVMDDYTSNFLSVNQRVNLGPWRFNSSIYYNQSKTGNYSTQGWNSNNIFVTRNLNTIKSTLTLGQSILGSALFDSNNFIGMSLATSNEMLPESEKGYSPVIKGVAETRSKLTIRQNNNILYQEFINPGPYNIDNLNSVGTSGDYEVELTSEQGIVTKYTVPYSSLPNLLRHGRYNYALAAGQLDIFQADKNKFIQGSIGYGLPLDTTIYTGYQVSEDYLAFGAGLGKDLGNIGAVSVDSIQAKAKVNGKNYAGNSYRILYAKSFSETGTNIQLTGYRYSTSNYYSFTEASYNNTREVDGYFKYSRYERKKNSFQVNLSQSLASYGQLYLWGNIISYWGSDMKSQNTQIGWNKNFADLNNINLSLSYNKNKYKNISDDMFYLSFSMPLSNIVDRNRMYFTNSVNFNKTRVSNSTSIYGDILDNKLNYNIYQTISNNAQDTSNINARYKADSAEVHAGSTITKDSRGFDYGMAGSILVHKNGLLFSREAADTAILVEAKGAPGAELENTADNIKVNSSGYALVPYATAYHYNDVAISPETFGAGYDIDGKVKKVAPTRGAVSKVVFDVRKGYNFVVLLKFKNKPIKFGTLVTSGSDSRTSIVNDDSTVYLTGVQSGDIYRVKIDSNNTCRFTISYDDRKGMKSINNINSDCN